ncbi:MAG: hypothetical protein COB36_08340 [Alphaproteobacteria bacterium]|nr:MAG: hypothetical protein COB36_08340 [Alphaproteobacteria bacterium]
MFKKMTIAAVLTATLLSSTAAFAADKLNFGIIATESTINLKKSWTPYLDAMEKSPCPALL